MLFHQRISFRTLHNSPPHALLSTYSTSTNTRLWITKLVDICVFKRVPQKIKNHISFRLTHSVTLFVGRHITAIMTGKSIKSLKIHYLILKYFIIRVIYFIGGCFWKYTLLYSFEWPMFPLHKVNTLIKTQNQWIAIKENWPMGKR